MRRVVPIRPRNAGDGQPASKIKWAASVLNQAEMKELRRRGMEPSEPALWKGLCILPQFAMCVAAGCQALEQMVSCEHGEMERMRSE